MPRAVTLSCHSNLDLQNKVSAIKGVRVLTGLGLKEAKDLVERINPGHVEVLSVASSVLEPRYSESIQQIKSSGLTVTVTAQNTRARKEIADQIRGIVTYATMSAQYDIGRALLDVMETYCPEPADEYKENINDEDDK